ncbi:MAG: hypothetical protein Nkreftii_000046 [Candidatus Nitrospira kreftii]|uniref:HNH endonuclease 5 domain-containing protein n=1 Tax=Candidatus Nitrospira kreftii TaxID=2652173 RepID=A0A7S8FAL9_9BACT|nr:MAG: hypothetical protein Nkreftii_000046 [Candidatus Nitrospira kreftii]
MARCHGCKKPLNTQNDSRAHIIPNALGGRLAPKGLICQTCNTRLDEAADNALVEAFGAWPTLLDLPRQRGQNPPKKISTRKGSQVRCEADGSIARMDVHYNVQVVSEGHKVEISAGDMKTMRELINRAAKQFPQLDPTLAERYARKVEMSLDDEIKLSLDFAPKAVFGGAISILWLFLLAKTGQAIMAWDRLLECITTMQSSGGKFRHFVDGLPGLSGPSIGLSHKIIVRSVPGTGELIGYIEILGVLKIGGLFACGPIGVVIEHIYAYDLLRNADRSNEFSIASTIFDAQEWRSVGLGPFEAEALKVHFKGALHQLATYIYSRKRGKGTGILF